MAGKNGVKIQIGFTKKDGKAAEFWATAPEDWDRMGAGERDAWLACTANKHHAGATEVKLLGRG